MATSGSLLGQLDTISGVSFDAASRVHLMAAGNTRTHAAPPGWGVETPHASTSGSSSGSSSSSRQACRAAGPRGASAHFSSPICCVPHPAPPCPSYGWALWAPDSLTHANSAEFITTRGFYLQETFGMRLLHYLEG